jgi:coproporphyrinogen III oxidase-like Fe-S oxidoreductase
MTTAAADQEKTGLGNYFIANYPPFSFWKPSFIPDAERALNSPPRSGVPLGLYLHIPFCRKRCKFCYFRVYTDKNARDIEVYLDALLKEVELLGRTACVGGRSLDYVYFGGGTPSYLSATQLDGLMTRLRAIMPWDEAREVTFECEPGTLQKHKLEMLRKHGITRLSLGVENPRYSSSMAAHTLKRRFTAPTAGLANSTFLRSILISSPAWSARTGTTGAKTSGKPST